MNSDRMRLLALLLLPLLAACEHDLSGAKAASTFGEANRQTLMAQVIDPDPQYESAVPPTSAEHAAQAVDRYKRDAVKKPDKVRSTQVSSGSSSGSN